MYAYIHYNHFVHTYRYNIIICSMMCKEKFEMMDVSKIWTSDCKVSGLMSELNWMFVNYYNVYTS